MVHNGSYPFPSSAIENPVALLYTLRHLYHILHAPTVHLSPTPLQINNCVPTENDTYYYIAYIIRVLYVFDSLYILTPYAYVVCVHFTPINTYVLYFRYCRLREFCDVVYDKAILAIYKKKRSEHNIFKNQ